MEHKLTFHCILCFLDRVKFLEIHIYQNDFYIIFYNTYTCTFQQHIMYIIWLSEPVIKLKPNKKTLKRYQQVYSYIEYY